MRLLVLLALLIATPAKAVAPLIFVVPVATEVLKIMGLVAVTTIGPALTIHYVASDQCAKEIKPYLQRCHIASGQFVQPDHVKDPLGNHKMSIPTPAAGQIHVLRTEAEKADLNRRCVSYKELDDCLRLLDSQVRRHKAVHPSHPF